MHHLLNTPGGRFAKTQQDLVRIATGSTTMKEEELSFHPLALDGFVKFGEDGLERMDGEIFHQSVTTLIKSRPSHHKLDLVPQCEYTEKALGIRSPELFRMSFEELASVLAEEFVTNSKMVGFRIELHDVFKTTDSGGAVNPSKSLYVYESKEDYGDESVPLRILVTWRTNW